ncbi:peptidase [Catellatospora sp. TT07R-123]|uniref:oxygenase MpaB family protein n=1 Tax=Catellatospora sp. TT07R-123 TaxID=2733863 RepID=UPI001B2E1068|nr:oxygenase MpaB family protein [Catellatospora sp. TT07R-123]GHJ43929.1 peptidase [Catellatospora sp. TT07R-123]
METPAGTGRSQPSVTDHYAVYRHLALREFGTDMRLGLNLAFYRTFAVPAIARLLLDTGELTERTRKRADDTGLMMYELIAHGPDHPRARHVIAMLNRIHRVYDISPDEYRYVLGTFVFIPTRWIDRYGPRRLRSEERAATWHFYRAVGRLMNIGDLPATWAEFETWFDAYERANFAHDDAATRLIDATRDVLANRFPKPLRRFAAAAGDALLDEPVRRALGVPRPNPAIRAAVHLLLKLSALVRRLRPVPEPFFVPGRPSRTYPDGYRLADLGPDPIRPVARR